MSSELRLIPITFRISFHFCFFTCNSDTVTENTILFCYIATNCIRVHSSSSGCVVGSSSCCGNRLIVVFVVVVVVVVVINALGLMQKNLSKCTLL